MIDLPKNYKKLQEKCEEISFTMPSDLYIGPLLKTLITSRPAAHVLELGTGIGLSLIWMMEGLDSGSSIITVDNDPRLTNLAKEFFGGDNRLEIINEDASIWLKAYKGPKFDFIFADAWPGKYSELEITLELIKVGGFYVIDDMSAQPNWPGGHAEKVDCLISYLESRDDFNLTKMNWSTGVIIAVRKA